MTEIAGWVSTEITNIEDELRDIYKINLSTSAISIITNKVTQAAIEWQNRPLDRLYMIVWMDGIVFKVRETFIGKGTTAFFDFPVEIRSIIYTTNLIENLNGKIRKYTKTKLSFPTDDALRKSVWLAISEIEKRWTVPVRNWGIVMNQFIAIFENRIGL